MSYFDRSVTFTLKHEGGYNFDRDDPGGETRFGISKRSYPLVDIVRLTVEKAKDIYRADYWDKMNCDEYEWPLCLVVFDTAVNLGRARTNRMLEQLTSNNPKQKALDLIKLRKQHYERLVLKRRSFQKFLKGWLNRVSDLEKEAFFR